MEYLDYQIKRLSDKNFNDIVELFNLVFKKEISREKLYSKYSTSDFIEGLIGFIAYYNGKPVSFYGTVPQFVELNGEPILVAQSSDAMTHPDHLRKGLFVHLAQANFNYCKEIGVNLIYGFPNANSKPGFVKKLNWEFTSDLETKLIDVKCLPILFFSRVFKGLAEKYNKKFEKFLSLKRVPLRYFKSNLLDDGQFGVMKNSIHLNYKSNWGKSFFVKINGKVVWLKPATMFLLVGDVEECTDDEFDEIISVLKSWCFKYGVPHIRFNISQESKLYKLLKGVRSGNITYAVGGINFTKLVDFKDLKFTLADNDTF